MNFKRIASLFAATILATSGAAGQTGGSSLPITDSEPPLPTRGGMANPVPKPSFAGPASEFPTTGDADNADHALAAIEKLFIENRKLRADLDDARKTAAAMTAEAEVFKRQVKDLTDRMEALGASTANPTALEQRLLQAVNALRQSEAGRDSMLKSLVRLVQVATEYAKKPDPEAKLVLETELKSADEAVTRAISGDMFDKAVKAEEPAPDLMNGKVSAVKPELSCVVLNLGSRHGVKVGMPFQIRRGEKVVATVRVVDARQTFCGAVIQNLVSAKDPIQLGDAVKVESQFN